MTGEQTVLIVGGPDSGKTNYLGRLWLAIHGHHNLLEVDGIPSDLTYLNQIAGYYLKGQFAPHTSKDVRAKVIIPIKTINGGISKKNTLAVPDVSGEEWLDVYHKRGWTDHWEQLITGIVGCLLFIRVDSVQNIAAIDWVNWPRFYKHRTKKKPEIPTQVILVDWLQFLTSILSERTIITRPRIGIIVSAYDLVPDDQKSLGPDMYLKSNFPLFWQFIHTIDNVVDVRVFGTSIAGGDFVADPEFRKRFIESNPGDAGCVYYHSDSGVSVSKDITLPVAWAMGISS